jgi:hypothetical protein
MPAHFGSGPRCTSGRWLRNDDQDGPRLLLQNPHRELVRSTDAYTHSSTAASRCCEVKDQPDVWTPLNLAHRLGPLFPPTVPPLDDFEVE